MDFLTAGVVPYVLLGLLQLFMAGKLIIMTFFYVQSVREFMIKDDGPFAFACTKIHVACTNLEKVLAFGSQKNLVTAHKEHELPTQTCYSLFELE